MGAGLAYDEANRVISATIMGHSEYYGYAPDNKRIYRLKASGGEEWTFYESRGEKLGTFTVTTSGTYPYLSAYLVVAQTNVWFAGKLVNRYNAATYTQSAVYRDRLGSERGGGQRYYPYGDEITSTANDTEKFGTYFRDSFTTLDYADQRYYAGAYGRFNSADQYMASAGPSDPSSWNRFSYTRGDPVNRVDPSGQNDLGCGAVNGFVGECDDGGWDQGDPIYDSGGEGVAGLCYTNPTWALAHAAACGMAGVGAPIQPPTAPVPPPLTCDSTGATTWPAQFLTGTSGAGITGTEFGVPIAFTFSASGGTGSYSFSVAQTITSYGSLTYASGLVLNGSGIPVTDRLAASEFYQNGSSFTFTDAPGVWVISPLYGPAVSAHLIDAFTTNVTVTSGSQSVQCPEQQWLATISWAPGQPAAGSATIITGDSQ